MKKIWWFAFFGLMVAGLPLFAGGTLDSFGAKSASGEVEVVEAAEVAEMPTEYPPPRRRQGLNQAAGQVYAAPVEVRLESEAEQLPPPAYAISGVRGQQILEGDPMEAVDIIVELPERVSFAVGFPAGRDVSDWITNLPKGLEARAYRTKRGDTKVKIYVSGTPEVTMREAIRVTVPGTYLSDGNARSFVSPTESESVQAWEAGQTE
jgi:hypothetical protein